MIDHQICVQGFWQIMVATGDIAIVPIFSNDKGTTITSIQLKR
ncbi:hypothetical protein AM1_B0026 (plasmid) [Acaryochloris marina MBIC11017]|uniref:Uncharacterized protein n=1 Tax=Acaryochloris marina (strain MBIC 11017) TaxID=329726 RepID=A8ZLY3_ACAM1|nr:hypothetical protein AM1_B0026 [Acaryochloris marina MBIC11017]